MLKSGLSVDQMALTPNAREAALLVQQAWPSIVFTSGRRFPLDQARAMAKNSLVYGVDWLTQTYKNREMVAALASWVSMDARASTEAGRTQGFYEILVTNPSVNVMAMPHVRGDAWDAQCPRFVDGRIDEQQVLDIKWTIEHLTRLLGLELVLIREGAHRVIHAQYQPFTDTRMI